MKLSDFHIGQEFFNDSRKKWRCTDVGTRGVLAICIDLPHEIVEAWNDAEGALQQRRVMTNDASWFNGLPFAVAEHVFDEHDIETCYATKEELDEAYPPEEDLRPYSVAMKSLEEMIRELPPDAQRKVEDFVKQLVESTKPASKRKLDQRWAGGLKRYRNQYISLELQRKALEWRGD